MNPSLWYPQGAGGMWLNYFIFCTQTRTVSDQPHVYFEYPYIKQLIPNYLSYFTFCRHVDDYNHSVIKFGGDRYWFNFYLNVCAKKVKHNDYQGLVDAADALVGLSKHSVPFNLDWGLIFTNPRQLTTNLSDIAGIDITYNSYSARSVTQYINSCPSPDINSAEFQSSMLYRAWAQTVHKHYDVSPDEILKFSSNCYFKP